MFEQALPMIGLLLRFVPYAVISFIPFSKALRVSKPRLALLLAAMTVALLAFGQAARPTTDALSDYISYTALIACMMAIALGVYMYAIDAPSTRRLFVIMLCCNYAGLVVGAANFACNAIFGYAYVATSRPEYILTECAALIITAPLFIYFLLVEVRPALSYTRSPSWNVIWFIPTIFFVSIIMFAMPAGEAVLSSYNFPSILLALGLGLFTALTVIMRMLNMNEHALKLERDVSIADRQLELQASQYAHIQERVEEARAARHDLRHHLSVLQALNASGDYAALDAYLSEYAAGLVDESLAPLCKNIAVDALTRFYDARAKDAEVLFEHALNLDEKTGIRSSDLCIVLGNLLENALEACSRMKGGDPFVRLNARMVGNAVVIVVENSYEDPVERHGETFISSKRTGGTEGIGISSVRAVAERYAGVAEFEADGRMFRAKVMLGGG